MGHIFKSLKGCFTWHCVFTALIIMAEKRSLLQWKVNSIVLFLCYHKAWESELVRLIWYFRKFFSLLCMTIDSESSNTEAFCTKVHHWKILLFCLTEISLWPLWARGSSCSSNITLEHWNEHYLLCETKVVQCTFALVRTWPSFFPSFLDTQMSCVVVISQSKTVYRSIW